MWKDFLRLLNKKRKFRKTGVIKRWLKHESTSHILSRSNCNIVSFPSISLSAHHLLINRLSEAQEREGKEGNRQLHSYSEDMLKFAPSAKQVIWTAGWIKHLLQQTHLVEEPEWLYPHRLGIRDWQREGDGWTSHSYQHRSAKQMRVILSCRLRHGCPPKLLMWQNPEEGVRWWNVRGMMERQGREERRGNGDHALSEIRFF